LVRIALKGFSKPWDSFVHGIVAIENLPNRDRLWDDFMQEEMRLGSNHAGQQQGDEEENFAKARTRKDPIVGLPQRVRRRET
jgi:hypothetical protein